MKHVQLVDLAVRWLRRQGCRKKLPEHLWERIDRVRSLIAASGVPAYVLGLTKGGDPLHPLMLPYTTPLREWKP